MVYDLKTYKKIVSEAMHSTPLAEFNKIPFLVIDTGTDYICSTVRLSSKGSQKNTSKLYDFSFTFNSIAISESNVWRIELFQHLNGNIYERQHLDYGKILSPEDLKDFLLILYKSSDMEETQYQIWDISIYANEGKVCELKEIKSLAINKSLDKTKIPFYRFSNNMRGYGNERWFYTNGTEYSENELKLSLCEWNTIFGSFTNSLWNIENIYSDENELPYNSGEIIWNSEKKCLWKCPLGHRWASNVNELTTGNIYRSYCPVCREKIPQFTYNSDDKRAQYVYGKVLNAFSEYETTDIDAVIDSLEEEMAELQEMQSMGILWYDHARMQDSVSFYFTYPNGKHGDIDKYICEKYGLVSQIGEFVFQALISTDHYEKIELLSESYADNKLLSGYENDEISSFLSKHNVMHRLSYLASMAHVFQMPTNKHLLIDRNMTIYRTSIREKRTEIYNALAGENKTTRRWTSEQLLFHIIKGIYPDAIFQFKSKWLGHQSLDIFVPSKNFGIEYQGLQHYQPVDLFGGEEQFKERQRLDERKRMLCKENGVKLIEWKYTSEVTEENVKKILEIHSI